MVQVDCRVESRDAKVSASAMFSAVGAQPQSFRKALRTAFQLRCGICVFCNLLGIIFAESLEEKCLLRFHVP